MYSPGAGRYEANIAIAYRFLDASIESSITVLGSQISDFGAVTAVFAFRGVDPSNPFDVSHVTAQAVGYALKPPDITPVTAGAVVVLAGCVSNYSSSSFAFSDGCENQFGLCSTTTAKMIGMLCTKPWDGDGAVTTATYTIGGGIAVHTWAAVSMALRPA